MKPTFSTCTAPWGPVPAPTILALDLGTHTGFAIGHDHAPQSGAWDLRPRPQDSPGMRYLYLRQKLEAVRAAYPSLSLVVYEQPFGLRGAAAQVLPGLVATLQAWCAEHGIDHTSVAPSTVKVHAGAKGNAGKDAMMDRARARGWSFGSDDEVDARWILDFAMVQVVPHGPPVLAPLAMVGGSRSGDTSDHPSAPTPFPAKRKRAGRRRRGHSPEP